MERISKGFKKMGLDMSIRWPFLEGITLRRIPEEFYKEDRFYLEKDISFTFRFIKIFKKVTGLDILEEWTIG